MKQIRYLIIVLIFAKFSLVFAQVTPKISAATVKLTSGYHPITIQLGLGSCSYYGELSSTEHSFKAMNYQINVGSRYRISPRFCVGALLRHAVMTADDKSSDSPVENGGSGRYERGLNFRTNTLALEAFGTFDIFPSKRNHIVEGAIVNNSGIFGINPYLIVGVGLMYYNPTTELNGKTYSLRSAKTSLEKQNGESYSIFTPVIMYGAGARVQLNRLFDLGFDVTFNNSFTDNLDDVASNSHYPDRTRPDITQLDLALSDRYPLEGLPARTSDDLRSYSKGKILDSYFMINIKVEYTIPGKLDARESKKLNTSKRHLQKGKGAKHHKFDKR